MSAESQPSAPARLPASDVSAGVGLAGLLGLFVWILLCRSYPLIADTLGLGGELSGARGVLSGPHAALAAMLFTAGPMALYSLLVDRVHLRTSTGLDWSARRPLAETWPVSLVKLIGLWATFAVLAGLYALGRWYWEGTYLFAMEVLAAALIPLMAASIPYVLWLDRFMVEPRDST